jgi:hypothetical protein
MIHETGKQFPISNAKGIEECRASVNEAFFDVLYYIKDPDPETVIVWRKEPLRYGVYVKSDIPFFIIDFPYKNWNFDLSVSIFKVQENEINIWLSQKANAITLYLINADTNVLEAMRLIGIENNIADKLRHTLKDQIKSYKNFQQVDNEIAVISNRLSTTEMINSTSMILL